MIEMLDIGIENTVAYRIDGKVTEDDMKSVLSIFKEKMRAGAKLSLYQEILCLGGAEFDAIIEKLKFFREFGTSNFNKIAVVTHKEWMQKIINLEGKLFKRFDMRAFSIEEKVEALEFLKSSS